jgi:two-component system, NarL family, response regulator YdfI
MQFPAQIDSTPSVWIVGRHPLAADYLLRLLNDNPPIQAQWIREDLLKTIELGSNSVLIVDNAAIETPAVEYIRRLNSQCAGVRHIVLDHALDIYTMFRLLSLGVRGFVLYEQVPSMLRLAIQAVCGGSLWVDSNVLQKYLRLKKRELHPPGATGDSLTPREDEIVNLARQRFSNKEIALMLSIQVSTVKFHLSNIFSKLQITSRSNLWRHSTAAPIPLGLRDRSELKAGDSFH